MLPLLNPSVPFYAGHRDRPPSRRDAALWVQRAFLGARAALQGNDGGWRERCVHVWHRSEALLSFLPQPPMMGHASCRHMESVICGELRRLIADGGALSTAGNETDMRKWQLGKWSLAGKEAEVEKIGNTKPPGDDSCWEGGFSEALEDAPLCPQYPLHGWC